MKSVACMGMPAGQVIDFARKTNASHKLCSCSCCNQLSARLSGKAHKIFQKQPRLSQKSTKSESKINTGGFPRATSSLKPNFGQTASPEKRKKKKIWTPKSNEIVAKIMPRGKLKATLLSSSLLYRLWSQFSSIFDPKIVGKPI